MNFPATPSIASESNEHPSITRSLFSNAPDNNKSSSRSIKRRLDDELVEYTFGLPGASLVKKNKIMHQQAMYSDTEEELLGTICTSHPTENKFQDLFEQNPHVFYPSRTSRTLIEHVQLLKKYQLLPDQSVQPLPKNPYDKVLSFSDAEDTMNDSELPDHKEEGMDVEMQTSESQWQVVVQSVAGGNTEFDKNNNVVLR